MRLETLKCAERAAGFAMAGVDDFATESLPELEASSELEPQALTWTPAEPVLGASSERISARALDRKAAQSAVQALAGWVRGLLRPAPNRRAHA